MKINFIFILVFLIEVTSFGNSYDYGYILPKTPEAGKYEIYGKNTLNSSRGIPNINIPIHQLNIDGVTIPITLNYNCNGVKVDEIPSAVGLNWFINAGGYISRDIRGYADELQSYGLFNNSLTPQNWYNNPDCDIDQTNFKDAANGAYDLLSDIFSYNFLNINGSFYFDKNRVCYKDLINGLKIEFWDKRTITDEFGNQYIFGGDSYSEEVNGITTWPEINPNNESRNVSATTGWRLKKIITKNGREINFNYIKYQFSYQYVSGTSARKKVYPYSSEAYSQTQIFTSCSTAISLLSSISVDNEVKVEFNYEEDSTLDIWKKKLSSIHVHGKANDQPRIYQFSYGKNNGNRLQLESIEEQNYDGSAKAQKYIFLYSGSVGSFGSLSKDRFGYYNAAGNTYSLIPSFNDFGSANRDISDTYITSGLLSKIVYPTGGSTTFFYEPNKEVINGESFYAPGVRVWKTENFDGGVTTKTRKYIYSGLSGYFRQQGLFWNHLKLLPDYHEIMDVWEDATLYLCNSQEYEPLDSNHDFYYSNVITEDLDANGISKLKMVEEYTNYGYNSPIPYLRFRKYYKDLATLIKTEEYTYNFGTIGNIVQGYYSEDSYWRLTDWYCNGSNMKNSIGPVYYYPALKLVTLKQSIINMSKSILTDHNPEGNVVNNTDFNYNSYNQLSSTKNWIFGLNDYKTKIYKYSNDYSISTIMQLETKNIIGIPIDVREFNKDNKLIFGKTIELDSKGNNINEYVFETTTPIDNNWSSNNLVSTNFILRLNTTYDNFGNVTQLMKNNDVPVSFLWGYENSFPVAKIEGADYSTSLGLINQTILNSPTNDSSLRTELSKLRSSLTNAHVTIYTYDRLKGVTSIVSPNGIITYYDYDSFGRLTLVKNDDGHILNRYKYNYKQ